jgi:hypothetical protein
MISKDLDAGLENGRLFLTWYYFGPLYAVQVVSGSYLKENLTFPNYVDHCE